MILMYIVDFFCLFFILNFMIVDKFNW